jgi:hypothetical protein
MRFGFIVLVAMALGSNASSQQTKEQAVANARIVHDVLGSKFKFEELKFMKEDRKYGPSFSFYKQDRARQYFENIHIYRGNISAGVTSAGELGNSKQLKVDTKTVSNLVWKLSRRFGAIPGGAKYKEGWISGDKTRYLLAETPFGFPISGNRNMVEIQVDRTNGKLKSLEITMGYRSLPPPPKRLSEAALLRTAKLQNPRISSGQYCYNYRMDSNGDGVSGKVCQLYYIAWTVTGSRVVLDPVTGRLVYDSSIRRSRK